MAFNINNFGAVTTRYGNEAQFFPTYWIYNAEADSFYTVNVPGYFGPALSTYNVNTGDKISISTTTVSTSQASCFSGTFINNAGVLSISWDRTLFFNTTIANISGSASTTYFGLIPYSQIVAVSGVISAAVTVASATITFGINAVPITGGQLVVAVSGSAPGAQYHSAATAANLQPGLYNVSVSSDGGSTTACSMVAGIEVVCPTNI